MRARRARLSILSLLIALGGAFSGTVAAWADSTPTPTNVVVPESTATPTPLPTATPTAVPTATAHVVATPRPESKRKHKHRHRRKSATPAPGATGTVAGGRKHHKHPRKPTATPTPTATATPTPVMQLSAEDSVSPVTCNGPGKPYASRPFLDPPFHGFTSVVSFFDHDSPNFVRDGEVIVASGAAARYNSAYQRPDFPAYWDPDLRQYLYYDGHNGYDYNISYEPVYAAARGKVIFARYEYPTMPDHGYGQMIMIDHRNGYVTLYGHLSKLLVHKGERVRRGQQIAVSGNTGHSTGPHLHFTVFHNCTPTDPYGWNGATDDPLSGYQGESSIYLWRRQPGVANPVPAWPHLTTLPTANTTRILLLRLPSPRLGTSGFTSALRAEAEGVVTALRDAGLDTRIDMLDGAVAVDGPLRPERAYALPQVVSITTPDTEVGAREDVLNAMARAALHTGHRGVTLGAAPHWTAMLVPFNGRVLLVGKGRKGGQVVVKVPTGRGGETVRKLWADPVTGTYAIDLGKLSASQVHELLTGLKKPPARHVKQARKVAAQRRATVRAPLPLWPIGVVVGLLAALGAGPGRGLYARRRKRSADEG